jgi:hypothetical protein
VILAIESRCFSFAGDEQPAAEPPTHFGRHPPTKLVRHPPNFSIIIIRPAKSTQKSTPHQSDDTV